MPVVLRARVTRERVDQLVVLGEGPVGEVQRHVVRACRQPEPLLLRVGGEEHSLQPTPVVARGHVHAVVVVEVDRRWRGLAGVAERVVVGALVALVDEGRRRLAVVGRRLVSAVVVDGQLAGVAGQLVLEGDLGGLAGPPHDGGTGIAAAVGPHRRLRPVRHDPHVCLLHRDRDVVAAQHLRDAQGLLEGRRHGDVADGSADDGQAAAHPRVEGAVERVDATGDERQREVAGRAGRDEEVEERVAAGAESVGRHGVGNAVVVGDSQGAALLERDVRVEIAVGRATETDRDRHRGRARIRRRYGGLDPCARRRERQSHRQAQRHRHPDGGSRQPADPPCRHGRILRRLPRRGHPLSGPRRQWSGPVGGRLDSVSLRRASLRRRRRR